jgi:diguanylate cyclase (GGDEF)-like protein
VDDAGQIDRARFREHVSRGDLPRIEEAVGALIADQRAYSLQYELVLPGGCRTIQEQGEVLFDESGRLVSVMGTVLDITERVGAQEQIQRLSYFDVVTGQLNRAGFVEEVEAAVERAEALGTSAAAIFLNLDRFKRVNDSLGHSEGDALLKRVGLRLVRRLDAALDIRRRQGVVGDPVLARFGGDVFTVLLPDLEDTDAIEHVAE